MTKSGIFVKISTPKSFLGQRWQQYKRISKPLMVLFEKKGILKMLQLVTIIASIL